MPSDTEASTTQPAAKPPTVKKPKSQGPRPKRGPARPYRKLADDVLNSRITKLEKRIQRAGYQVC